MHLKTLQKSRQISQQVSLRIEDLEDRQMMAADISVDLLADGFFGVERNMDAALDQIEQQLINAHDLTGLTSARNAYGLSGAGQTVVVIDTGIAYDHDALGGGYGVSYRVVGGYDFAEGDSDAYDDTQSHGTHVAGIIGSDNGTYMGVAPEVDLVSLRVFNDGGAGYFNWIDSALDWVHANRNSFANPITTVNLSIGSSYNGDDPPPWAMLEEEFALLEADGIFISVAAGNSFTSYNATGLSYPAASQYVVAVASVDDGGSLSYFSQRNSRVIAAPGRGVMSTIPDYAGNNNGNGDDFGSMSGTSMAAPYVAGASVLIREALEFVGTVGINQDMIYDWMRNTADTIYDSATNQNYTRLNVGRALDAILPDDEFGSTAGAAHGLGVLLNPTSLNGTVGRLDDMDYFSFTASDNGSIRVDFSSTHSLAANWDTSGLSNVVFDSGGFSFSVTAGQVGTVGVGTSNGIGHFAMTVTMNGNGTGLNWLQDRAFLEELYRDVLYREADNGGLGYWLSGLQSSMTRDEVVENFTLSHERLAPIVDGYYARYLHRGADAGGRAFWISNLQSGASIADVEHIFINSSEYSFFNASNGAFVDSLYGDILYRGSDSSGHNYWVSMLNGGTSRDDVSQSFLDSSEKIAQTVDFYFAQVFDRAIDDASRTTYVDQIRNDAITIDALIESWYVSDDYYARASGV